MININQKSAQTKILIQRDNISNDSYVKDNYVTEDELQEQLKNINAIPYLIIDNISILDGDWQKVYDAISNNQPYLIYKKRPSDGWLFTDDGAAVRDNYIEAIFCIETYHDNIVYLYYTGANIYPDRVEGVLDDIIDIPTQFKSINGETIVGEGDIIIEGGNGNIVELTQEEYDNITPEQNTLYVITDAPSIEIPDTSEFVTENELNSKGYTTSNSFKTINNQSIVGSGNITIAGGGSEPLYLWKEKNEYGESSKLEHNISIYNYITSLYPSEEYPLLVLRDNWNDTISNNVWTDGSTILIQCCNSRVDGATTNLMDERYYLGSDGVLSLERNEEISYKSYVDEQLGNINNILENIIG